LEHSAVHAAKKPPTLMTLQRQISTHTKQIFDLTIEAKSLKRSVHALQLLKKEFRRLE